MERRIGFLGPNGTFSEEAARFFFNGHKAAYIPFPTIPDVLDAIDQGKADIAVVPIENSIEGTVNLTMDWLIHHMDVPICGELDYPISQHLFAAKSMEYAEVTKILSHPQAIAQCRLFLRQHLPHAAIEYTRSTADAVKLVGENPDQPWAAIGNLLCKEIYPVRFLREHIEDHNNNYTRFIVVSPSSLEFWPTKKEKTTILVTLPSDFPGALHQVLAAFAWRKINLSKIESRPTKTGLGNYHFMIDIEQKIDDVLLPGAFAEIEALGCQVRQLGSYPCYLKELTVKS